MCCIATEVTEVLVQSHLKPMDILRYSFLRKVLSFCTDKMSFLQMAWLSLKLGTLDLVVRPTELILYRPVSGYNGCMRKRGSVAAHHSKVMSSLRYQTVFLFFSEMDTVREKGVNRNQRSKSTDHLNSSQVCRSRVDQLLKGQSNKNVTSDLFTNGYSFLVFRIE
jgi:hypothetical protein